MHATTTSTESKRIPNGEHTAMARTGRLACRAPFDLQRSLDFLSGFTPMHGEQAIARNVLTKAFLIGGRAIAVRAFQANSDDGIEAPVLRYGLTASRPVDAEAEAETVRRLAHFLSADEDMAPFYELAGRDPAMVPVLRRLRGLHHVKFPTPFEAACWGVLNQRIGLHAARAMKDAIVRRWGDSVTVDGAPFWAFPNASAVARDGEAAIAALIGNPRKARAVHAVSRAFAAVGDDFFRDATDPELIAWLEAIHGVGDFTTGFVMYRGLGRFRSVPMSPKFTLAAERVYGRRLSRADLEALFAQYGRWGGHWAVYVWTSTFPATIPPRDTPRPPS